MASKAKVTDREVDLANVLVLANADICQAVAEVVDDLIVENAIIIIAIIIAIIIGNEVAVANATTDHAKTNIMMIVINIAIQNQAEVGEVMTGHQEVAVVRMVNVAALEATKKGKDQDIESHCIKKNHCPLEKKSTFIS